MKMYAIVKNKLVWNVIVAAEPKVVETVLEGISADYDQIVEVTEATGPASPEYEYINGIFRRPKPSDAYVWNAELWDWSPKEPMPTDGQYFWNIRTEAWEKVTFIVE